MSLPDELPTVNPANPANPASPADSVLPYSLVVGQEEFRRALEIAHVAGNIGGVLATGERGTAKTTLVRAFSRMLTGGLPVTLPIGATDDRVLGGWELGQLLRGLPERQDGLLVEAARSRAGLLYVDEINLLDDYLINIILDVISTGILSVQRDHRAEEPVAVRFTLVGTMNPDEGGLRPQLLDRFGLVAPVTAIEDAARRRLILERVMRFEAESGDPHSPFIAAARRADEERRALLDRAKSRLGDVTCGPEVLTACARLAEGFQLAGHRGELVMVRAARALAAIEEASAVSTAQVRAVAKLALVHRRAKGDSGTIPDWTPEDDETVARLTAGD